MTSSNVALDQKIDLTNCDREPIHTPGAVQPHGVLVVVSEPDFIIRQISENAGTQFGGAAQDWLGQPLRALLTAEVWQHWQEKILPQPLEANPAYLPAITIGEQQFEVIAHRWQGHLLLEFEVQTDEARAYSSGTYAQLRSRLSVLSQTVSIKEFCAQAADAVRAFTGFDRVMVYRFLDDGAGHVLAEARRADLESFLELHYPASDIPQQARRLFVLNPIRVLPDIDALAAPLLALANTATEPLDMSYTTIRAVSPIHLEYLRNMGVRASMSISIVQDGVLWGLFACHHYTPRYVPHAARMATEFLAHLMSLQVSAKEAAEQHEYAARLQITQAALIENASHAEDLGTGLLARPINLLTEIEADGAALLLGGEIKTIGTTPNEAQIRDLAAWLWAQQNTQVFAHHHLALVYPAAAAFQEQACGVLAARLTRHSPEYLLWFRGEFGHTVNWAGDPNKPMEVGALGDRLTPRKSFALWQQSVAGQAKSWLRCEQDHAAALRHALVEIIIRRAKELQQLNEELERSNAELDSFAYVASHDLKEPLRGIHNYSHFLLEDYADKLDAAGVDKLLTLVRLTQRMEALIDSLLHYARLGRQQLQPQETNLEQVITESLEMLTPRLQESGVQVRIKRPLPLVKIDRTTSGEVLTNLITNAIKYNDKAEKWVEIGWEERAGAKGAAGVLTAAGKQRAALVFYVRDNGIGISPEHHEDIFRLFKRLHGRDEYSGGTGAELTIVKKIIERHGGRVWVESEPGTQTTFYFTLPGNSEE